MTPKQKAYKEENERFLEENLKNEGVMQLPCGVQYKILVKGNGTKPTRRSTVKVHYRGTLIDGREFDNSFSRRAPEIFRVNEVIEGWQEALMQMPNGSRWMIYIPSELGYGKQQVDIIKGFSTLVFEVELLGVK
ncbi:MAG: FKBP-type peptidyl-prolyl cis-trans isomerase [Bacteroidales bacterium]